jgi:hypothetical protein
VIKIPGRFPLLIVIDSEKQKATDLMRKLFHWPTISRRRRLLWSIALLFLPLHASAAVESMVWLDLGYRQDNLDWNIAGDISGANPNVISELKWQNLQSVQLQGGFEMLWRKSIYMRGRAGYGGIRSGDNQDSDFAYDNRQGEFSRSNNQADGGHVTDASIGLGVPYDFHVFASGRLRVIPMLGYSSHSQHVTMKEGVQTLSDTSTARAAGLIDSTESIVPVGYRLAGLDATYTANWKGPWLGADLDFMAHQQSRFIARVELHRAYFYGEGDWNLRADYEHPRSYEHVADGYGVIMTLEWQAGLASKWDARVLLTLQSWSTDPGLIRFFKTDGGTPEQQLNEVNWRSATLFFSVGYDFSHD